MSSAGAKKQSKTLVLTGTGGYDKFKVEQRDVPKATPGHVVVHIRASGINFAELMCRQGTYDKPPKLPGVLGLEGAGQVTQVGTGVTNVRVSILFSVC